MIFEILFAICDAMVYNHSCDGDWCSGSTWASDSHCVGSIPISPAKVSAPNLLGVLFLCHVA